MNKNQILLTMPYIKKSMLGSCEKIKDQEIQRELLVLSNDYLKDIFNSDNPKELFTINELVDNYYKTDVESVEMKHIKSSICYCKSSNIKQTIQSYYVDYLDRLHNNVGDILESYDQALVIESYSFSSKPLSYERRQEYPRVDICISIDDNTPKGLYEYVKSYFQGERI